MNIGEEKAVLYSMMQEITQERRKLTEIYFSLKERIDQLNEIETRGLSELDMKGYVDAFNKNNLQVVKNNLQRESKQIIKDMEQTTILEKKPSIPKEEIETAKEKEVKSNTRVTNSLDKVSGVIAHILKEYGSPMSVADLYEAVNSQLGGSIKVKNFRNNILPRTIRVNKNITRATRGYYQYTHS